MMNLYCVYCEDKGEYSVTFWGTTPDDVEPFLEQLEQEYPSCLCAMSDAPLPQCLWTEHDKHEYQQLQAQPSRWEMFNYTRLRNLEAVMKSSGVSFAGGSTA